MKDWAVYRQDSNGCEFLVKQGLSEKEAEDLAAHYISLGHHQHFWADKEPPQAPDFSQQLRDMLASGSSPAMAIKVIRSQGATDDDCIAALESAGGRSEKTVWLLS